MRGPRFQSECGKTERRQIEQTHEKKLISGLLSNDVHCDVTRGICVSEDRKSDDGKFPASSARLAQPAGAVARLLARLPTS